MIFQNHWRAVQVTDDYIHIAVVEKIANRQTPRYPRLLQRGASLVAGVAESAVPLVELQDFRLAIAGAGRQSVNLGIYVAAHRDQVEPAIVVEICECRAPLHPGQ